MRNIHQIIRYLLYTEMIVLGVFYIGSPHGVQSVTRLAHECEDVEQQVLNVKRDIATLELEVDQWESEPFYKEKIAREQLQMARKNEVIYHYSVN
ncbi:septum formation initiator family protein [Candidatus Dependentiae bacterium]|nr:septum formation initiator family protein [Candidatus Dependentiae bacterium]